MESATLPAQLDFVIFKGDTFTRDFEVTNNDVPWNFTGSNVKFILQYAGAVVATFTSSPVAGITIASNTISLKITDEQTAAFEAKTYEYDLVLIDAAGDSRTWVSGNFIVRDKV